MARESSDSAAPPQLADGELAKWKKIWRAHGADRLPLPGDAEPWEQLPPLYGVDLRRVIGAFARLTGGSSSSAALLVCVGRWPGNHGGAV
eukprot:7567124-Pyramimonas_sp.AAC.1